MNDSTTENYIHVFTEDDCEDILVQIDALYLAFLGLQRKRAMGIHFDPNHLATQVRESRSTDASAKYSS